MENRTEQNKKVWQKPQNGVDTMTKRLQEKDNSSGYGEKVAPHFPSVCWPLGVAEPPDIRRTNGQSVARALS